MGLFGFESKDEKVRKAVVDSLPLYFTALVDFDYTIVDGSIYAWCRRDNLNDAYELVLHNLKQCAVNQNADAVIDAKISISVGNDSCMEGTGYPFYVVNGTGVAVKRK